MEELNELKNLVMQNLEKNGYLSNIRAQIRSTVFKTLDPQQTGSSKKGSPFQNLKVQKLAESPQGQNSLQLIQELLQFYQMENSLKIFSTQTNIKSEPKREKLSSDNSAKSTGDEPVLYRVFANFLAKTKKTVPAVVKKEEPKEKPAQMKEDESEGEVEEEIEKNDSRKFGESEQFGMSQGHDITVDSMQLEEYDYYEQIE